MNDRPTLIQYSILICAYLLLAWVTSFCAFWLLAPNENENIKAYVELVSAANEEYFTDVIQRAHRAERMATDPELKQVANFLSRAAAVIMKSGTAKTSDANSITGLTKAFITGLLDWGAGLEGIMLLIEEASLDFDQIDKKYQGLLAVYRVAKLMERVIFWGLIIYGGYAFFRHRKVVDEAINEHLQPLLQRLQSKDSSAGQPL